MDRIVIYGIRECLLTYLLWGEIETSPKEHPSLEDFTSSFYFRATLKFENNVCARHFLYVRV